MQIGENLPYDIDGNCVYQLPISSSKRFKSSIDGRHWDHYRENKRASFPGQRYLAKCKGSFHCNNEHFPFFIQYNKVNRRNFNSKGICNACGKKADERLKCEARKVWEFSNDEIDVVVKHFGVHTCSPSKAKREKEMKRVLNTSSKSAGVVKKNFLTDVILKSSKMKLTKC